MAETTKEVSVRAMPPGVNHIKLVTPDPDAVATFLTEVAGIPSASPIGTMGGKGPLGMFGVGAPPPDPHPPFDDGSGVLPLEQVYTARGADGTGGFIVGDEQGSRRFQVFHGPEAHIWAVAISAPDIEAARQRCIERGIPVTDIHVVTPLNAPAEHCRFLFARAGGVIFELMRSEDNLSPVAP